MFVAVEAIYLGMDNHCNAAIVRPINGRLAYQQDRYSKVTRHEHAIFPYCYPNVARPHEPVTHIYPSDTDEEEPAAAAAPALTNPLLAHSPDAAFDNLVDYDALVNAPQPDLEQDSGLPQAVRRSLREQTLSDQALRNIATLVSNMTDKPVYHFDTLSAQYDVLPPDNPFAYLFDPSRDKMWDDPTTFNQMMRHPMKEFYLEAMLKERSAWTSNQVYDIILKSDIPIDDQTGKRFKIMRNTPVWKTKQHPDQTIEKFKYRLCVNGMHQDKSPELCYESMVSLPSIRLFFDMVVRFGLTFMATDASEFYLHMDIRPDEQYYMEIPEGWSTHDRNLFCAALNKAVYGIPSASQTAGHALTSKLSSMGYTPCVHDSKLYVKWLDNDHAIFCVVHADDALWGTNNMTALKADLDQLDAEFCPLTRRENPDIFRGIEIRINEDGSITLHQAAYLRELAKTYDLHLQRVPETPGSASDTRGAEPAAPQAASHKQIHEYMVKQGCLQWAVICSPSCAFRVNWLARHMRNPQTYHTSEQLRCMTYMYSIATKGITFRRHSPLPDVLTKGYLYDDLVGWADATWADKADSADSKSTTGFLYESKIGPLAFHTKKQSCVTNSSCESEIMANRSCAMNGVWLRNLIKDIGFNFSKPTEIMQDNTGSIALCKTDAHHARSRHFRVACHYLKELYDNRIFRFTWVTTLEMVADALTKCLAKIAHKKFERRLTNEIA